MTGEKLSEWMATLAVSVDDLAAYLGISKGTLYNWRSKGVPEDRGEWVKSMLALYQTLPGKMPQRMVLEFSDDDFDLINQAANSHGELLRDWVQQAIMKMASDEAKIVTMPPPTTQDDDDKGRE